LRQRRYRVGFLATALLSLGGWMMMPFGPAFAINNLGVRQDQLFLMFMVSGASSLIMMPFIGKLSDKVSKLTIFIIATVWMVIAIIVYTNLTVLPFYIIIIVNALMMMGVMARMVPAMAMTSELPEMQDRGAFMSINSSLQQISGGIAAAISGIIVQQATKDSPLQNFDKVGYFIFFICMFSIYIFNRVNKSITTN
jgi:predicted MFS family arabinose efflux permease